MKKENLYVFYANENVAEELKKELNIRPYDDINNRADGNYELITNETNDGSIEGQLKSTKWSEVGMGRMTMLFYINVNTETNVSSVEKLTIIVRHKTHEEALQDSQESLKNILTSTDSNVTV